MDEDGEQESQQFWRGFPAAPPMFWKQLKLNVARFFWNFFYQRVHYRTSSRLHHPAACGSSSIMRKSCSRRCVGDAGVLMDVMHALCICLTVALSWKC